MDIDLLSKMVKELILDNDRVVLPGLGSFVAETIPSTFTDKGYTINPPYRRLSFRSKPDEGDILTLFYAKSNGLDVKMADKVVRDFVSELKSILFIRKTVTFPGLGRMRATKENAVFFIADENLDIYPDGIGLEAISLKTHQETKEEVEAAVVGLKAIVDEPVIVDEAVNVDEPSVAAVTEEPAPVEEVVPIVDSVETLEPVAVVEVEEPVEIVDVKPVERKASRKILKTILWTVISVVALLALFVALSRMFPQLLDNILYSPEELKILNLK